MFRQMQKIFLLTVFLLLAWDAGAEEGLADSVAHWTAAQAAAYYQTHENQRDKLRPLLMRRYMTCQDTMSYDRLRSLRRAFWNTDLQDSVNAMYLKRREELLPQIQAEARRHCEVELDSLEMLRARCKQQMDDMIGKSIEEAFKGLMGGFLPDGRADVENLYKAHCEANILVKDIKAFLAPYISRFVSRANAVRKGYINRIAGYYAASGNYKIPPFGYAIKRMPVDCPADDLMQLVALQGRVDWLHIGVTPSALAVQGTGVSLLRGNPLLTESQANRNNDSRRLAPIVNRIAAATATNICKSVYQTVDAVFATVAQKIKDSQQAFCEMVVNKY